MSRPRTLPTSKRPRRLSDCSYEQNKNRAHWVLFRPKGRICFLHNDQCNVECRHGRVALGSHCQMSVQNKFRRHQA